METEVENVVKEISSMRDAVKSIVWHAKGIARKLIG
jgi:hypothetical protein